MQFIKILIALVLAMMLTALFSIFGLTFWAIAAFLYFYMDDTPETRTSYRY